MERERKGSAELTDKINKTSEYNKSGPSQFAAKQTLCTLGICLQILGLQEFSFLSVKTPCIIILQDYTEFTSTINWAPLYFRYTLRLFTQTWKLIPTPFTWSFH